MKFSTTLATMSLALLAQAQVFDATPADDYKIRFGPGIDMGYDKIPESGAVIKRFKTTLNLGAVPETPRQIMLAWPGLFTESDDLVQSIASSMAIEGQLHCDRRDTTWCLFSYTWSCDRTPGVDSCTTIYADNSASVEPGQSVDIEYIYNNSNGDWLQTISKDGNTISSLITNSGKAFRLQIQNECQFDCYWNEMKVPEYSYTNTVVELTGPDDKGYLQWWHNASQIDISEIKRSEDGTRIEIDEIKFKKFEMPAQETIAKSRRGRSEKMATTTDENGAMSSKARLYAIKNNMHAHAGA